MRRIFMLAGIIILSISQNSFAIPSYDEADSYNDWLTETEYKMYVDDWYKTIPVEQKNEGNNEPNPNLWDANKDDKGFELKNKSGYKAILPFRKPVINREGVNDHWTFFALPKSVMRDDFKNIYVYSETDRNICHFFNNEKQGNYNYTCPTDSVLCYFAVVTKDKGDLSFGCNPNFFLKDDFDAMRVYLLVHPEYFNTRLAPTGGSDYQCVGTKCWVPSGVSCADAEGWFQIVGNESVEKTSAICNNLGGGNYNPPDPHAGYKHDVGLDAVKVREHGRSKWRDEIEVDSHDIPDMDFRARLKRKGDVWEDVCVDFYLSDDKDYDLDEDQFLGRKCKDLTDEDYADKKKKSVYLRDVDMADYIDNPETWYVFVEVHYDGGVNRSSEGDSDERAKIIVEDTTPLSDGTFIWSPNGAVPGMTCTQWKEPADPHSWGDNFLCTTRSEDIRWSADGPIAGMRCIQIYESRDPHFNNNYLCVPNESALNFVWSESGNMSDMYCVRTDEPKDKHSWDDNYLCWSDSGANGAGNSGIYYGAYDTVTTNTGATSPDVLPASVHLNDASGNVQAIYTPAEVPGLPDIAVRIENIGALPSSSEQKHKLKTSVFLTGPGYESGWKFTNKQTQISGFGTAGYAENIAFALPSDAVLNEGLYSITVSTDDTDKLTESNELNNTSPQVMFWVQNALPDIAVETLSVDDDLTEIEAGSKHDITIDVSNIAPVGGDARFPVVVQLWYDGDQLLGEQVIEAADLIAGGSTEVTISGWTVPFEEGAHTLTATATNKYVPYEANLSNNSLSQDITIIVTPGDPDCVALNPMDDLPETGSFDMSASSLEFPETINQGDAMHPQVLLCGVSGVLPKTRAIWAYARCDGTGFTEFDGDSEDDIQAGECDEERVNTDKRKATMDPGMYVMYFVANGVTRIPESDHSNNVQAKAFLLQE